MIAGFVAAIGACYLAELYYAHPPLGTVAEHMFKPQFAGSESLLLAVGILGATVMPHVIYLHSALTQSRVVPRNDSEARRLYRYTRIDVVIAMSIAGLINMAMLVVAATRLLRLGVLAHRLARGRAPDARAGARRRLGTLFALALLASGLSSSTVGTLSGQVVMQGFIDRKIPIFVRRAVTMLPALVVAWIGLDRHADARAQPGRALVRDPVRADSARLVHEQARPDGTARQPPADNRRARPWSPLISGAERLPALADVLRSSGYCGVAGGLGSGPGSGTTTGPGGSDGSGQGSGTGTGPGSSGDGNGSGLGGSGASTCVGCT